VKPFRTVAAYAPQGVTALGLGIVSAIFTRRPGLPDFDFFICADSPGPLQTDLGVALAAAGDISQLDRADLVLSLPGADFRSPASEAVLDVLRAARARGATVAGHCTGTFLLAAAGLLDGLEATTHWQFAGELSERYPRVKVRPDPLYIDEGSIVTGAGAAAGLDMCLHIVRRAYGAAVANEIARNLVIPPYRDGGQAQFLALTAADENDDRRLASVIGWARANLARNPTIPELASRAMMSHRSFARHFKAATGAPPHAWLRAERLGLAEELLETTGLPVEEIARQVGYRSAAVLREQFMLRRGVAPSTYRRTFARTARHPS
jgi:transcriptional regulator GlxA family with amidase domain